MEPDYIIVGAGSAGSLLAARLSETRANVLLLEAGPETWHPMIHIPAGVRSLHRNPTLSWNYFTEPHPDTANRRIHWPRGRVIGGSGSINGMLYVRGNPGDYDSWSDDMGCAGWSYAEVLPYFKKTERYERGDPHYRGRNGPLPVVDYKAHLGLTHRFVQAAQQAGVPFTDDYNGAQQEGVAYSQMTRLGRFRGSTAFALLRPARSRRNLEVKTNAVVTQLVFEGKRCVGVSFRKSGQKATVRARREVILCGGAINSPHLLMVSGVGPATELQALDIPVVHDSPGVGKNLIDHYYGGISARVRDEVSINELARGWRLVREVLRYVLLGDGALTYGVTASSVFTRSRPDLTRPDLQLLFTPASYNRERFGELEALPGITAVVCLAQPESRGTLSLRSADPAVPPRIEPNYLTAPNDVRALVAGVRLVRRIFASPALAQRMVGETYPGPEASSDEEIVDALRLTGTTGYHAVGTCRMGSDASAVVDSELRVMGVEGLRVVDASVMPIVPTGNTNAPTVMIAEKAADLIRTSA
ncbi:MAG: GMC family oxidoreductase N-terminal domain-containing protein [Burkholderiales bacterium]|jgi:choline dehydrogenase